ncbi:deoxynucleoside kinase [Mesorhizobium sp. Cs1321R2N1]|uniref:deoxynucleoside kinase n=1 Tax=Mesorhizobium sp. Cs1321R2N1 TaxID=3015174 RepID=UPI00301C35F1
MIIWLSGPTGAGKTSVASVLSRHGYRVIRETAPTQIFEAFAAEPQRYCYDVQRALMGSRKKQWDATASRKKVVFDRSIDEDIAVFCRMHLQNGYLNVDEFNRLAKFADSLRAGLPAPDLIIYLQASEDVLEQRLLIKGHPTIIRDNLCVQLQLYEDWISSRHESVVRIDSSRCKVETLLRTHL